EVPYVPSSLPAATTPIKHIVIIVQENQSFDHFFGTFPGLKAGFSIPLAACLPTTLKEQAQFGYAPCISPFNMDKAPEIAQANSLGHLAPAERAAYDNGLMDGFFAGQNNKQWGNLTVSYLTGKTLPNYWDLASYYALDANFFSSAMSYSWPNHLF